MVARDWVRRILRASRPRLCERLVHDRFRARAATVRGMNARRCLTRIALLGLLSGFAGWAHASTDTDSRRAHERVRSGEYVSLESILSAAEQRHPGRVISVDLDDDEYEVEILRADGAVVELEYDARTGRLLDEEFEDD